MKFALLLAIVISSTKGVADTEKFHQEGRKPAQLTPAVTKVVGNIKDGQIVRIFDPDTGVICFAITGMAISGGSGAAISCMRHR